MNTSIETVMEPVVETVMVPVTEPVILETIESFMGSVMEAVANKSEKKSLKPSFVTVAHFKQMTIVYYVMKQMEMMNMVNAETMQSMKQLIGIGVSGDTIKTFYNEMTNALDHTAELLAAELEASKPQKKRSVKKVNENTKPKSIVDTLIEVANTTDKIVEEDPLIVAMAELTVAEKPKRKYTKKIDETTDDNKPKRKYTKKTTETTTTTTVEPVVENAVVVEPVVETEKPKRKYSKKPKAETAVEVPKETETTNETETPKEMEKPKRKYSKKPKDVVQEVVQVMESADVVVSAELTNDVYDEEVEQPSMMVSTVTIDDKEYLLDENTNDVYDVNTEELIGKLVDNVIVK